MDYKAEQEMEVEALQAILMDDLTELTDDFPEGWSRSSPCYRIFINPVDEGESPEAADAEYKLELVFAHTPSYPDEAPLYKARRLMAAHHNITHSEFPIRGLSSADLADVNGKLAEQVEANVGMAMIYALVSMAQDWLREKAAASGQGAAPVDPAAARKAEEEAEERRLAEIRSHGTMVTPQTFAEWKQRFEAEMALQRGSLQGTDSAAEKKDKGPTGKQFFRQMEVDAAAKGGEVQEGDGLEDEADYEENGEELEDNDGIDDEEDEDDDDDDDFLDEYLADKAGTA